MRGSCQEKAERLHSLACHQRVHSWMQQSGAKSASSPDGDSGQGHGSLSQCPTSPSHQPITPSSPDSSSSIWYDLPPSISQRNSFSSDAPFSTTTQGALTCAENSHRPIVPFQPEEAPRAVATDDPEATARAGRLAKLQERLNDWDRRLADLRLAIGADKDAPANPGRALPGEPADTGRPASRFVAAHGAASTAARGTEVSDRTLKSAHENGSRPGVEEHSNLLNSRTEFPARSGHTWPYVAQRQEEHASLGQVDQSPVTSKPASRFVAAHGAASTAARGTEVSDRTLKSTHENGRRPGAEEHSNLLNSRTEFPARSGHTWPYVAQRQEEHAPLGQVDQSPVTSRPAVAPSSSYILPGQPSATLNQRSAHGISPHPGSTGDAPHRMTRFEAPGLVQSWTVHSLRSQKVSAVRPEGCRALSSGNDTRHSLCSIENQMAIDARKGKGNLKPISPSLVCAAGRSLLFSADVSPSGSCSSLSTLGLSPCLTSSDDTATVRSKSTPFKPVLDITMLNAQATSAYSNIHRQIVDEICSPRCANTEEGDGDEVAYDDVFDFVEMSKDSQQQDREKSSERTEAIEPAAVSTNTSLATGFRKVPVSSNMPHARNNVSVGASHTPDVACIIASKPARAVRFQEDPTPKIVLNSSAGLYADASYTLRVNGKMDPSSRAPAPVKSLWSPEGSIFNRHNAG